MRISTTAMQTEDDGRALSRFIWFSKKRWDVGWSVSSLLTAAAAGLRVVHLAFFQPRRDCQPRRRAASVRRRAVPPLFRRKNDIAHFAGHELLAGDEDIELALQHNPELHHVLVEMPEVRVRRR